MAKQELLITIRDRYRESSKKDKGRILDAFIAVTGHHRKHGIRLLGQSGDAGEKPSMIKGRRIYDEAVREAVITIWEAADRICGQRLKAALPHMVGSMERHDHLDLDPGVRDRLLSASAATLDRLLKPIRPTAGLEAIGQQLPFPVLGIDSDNDSVFINETLITYCANRGIEFTRSRPYRSNDQTWIEQKNGSEVRRFVGHDRYSGQVAGLIAL
ncbi:Uncharacterized protein y4rM [Geodia barretti]|uniref:Uncharacterized protein y4rM n=1 Tax=Geodia barretti TaxID=519541 RepID=A0AA35X1H7_GEOBA|nr:Uncharacterized protein y4rM [Geodia barretti]